MTEFKYKDVNINSYGVLTLMDDYLDTPTRRGSNQTIPYKHGGVFVEKYYDERSIMFGLTMKRESHASVESSLDELRKLLSPNSQGTLEMVLPNGDIRQVQASVDKSIQVSRPYLTVAQLVLEFELAEPFWRLSTAIADNTTVINANPTAMVVSNPGTVEENSPTIILTGPLQNTVITNSTNGYVLTYTGTIASPRVVTISVNETGEWIATDDLSANKIGNITHSGGPELMKINVGDNSLSIADSTATTGTVEITFNAPYL